MPFKMKHEDGTEIEVYTAEELQKETSGLKAKVDELLGESKSAKQKARELEEAQALAAEEQAKKQGEWQSLYEKEQKAKAELSEKYTQFQRQIQSKEIEGSAMSLANQLTRDTKRAELLKKEISQFTKYTESGVVFEMGGVQVDSAKILAHISENYPFLVDGTGSTGGGASGQNKGSGAAKTVNRQTFDGMNQSQRHDFIRSGGKVTD